MPVFQQLVLPAILQCQHHSGSPPSAQTLQLGGLQSNTSETKELGLGLGQYIFQIINRYISNETPPPSPSTAMNRTRGRVKRELLIKTTSLETRATPLWAISSRLITKRGFSEETSVWRSAASSGTRSRRPFHASWCQRRWRCQAKAALLNLNLWLIQRLTHRLRSMLSCAQASFKSHSAWSLKRLLFSFSLSTGLCTYTWRWEGQWVDGVWLLSVILQHMWWWTSAAESELADKNHRIGQQSIIFSPFL